MERVRRGRMRGTFDGKDGRCRLKFFEFRKFSVRPEESFWGSAERANEGWTFDRKDGRCRLKAKSGWGSGRMPQAKRICAPKAEYAKKEMVGKLQRYV